MDLWRLSNPVSTQIRPNHSRLFRKLSAYLFLCLTTSMVRNKQTQSGHNFMHSNLSFDFCPTPAHLWGAWVCLLFGPLLGSCRQQRFFTLPSLLKLNNPSCFSISSYVMSSSPVHLGGSPPGSWSNVLCCSSSGSRKCCIEGNCFVYLLAVLLLLLPGCGQPSLLKNMLRLSGNGCLRALCFR